MRAGYYSDKYFTRAREILLADRARPHVTMQVFGKASAYLGGIDEAIAILKLCAIEWDDLTVWALHDGDPIEPWAALLPPLDPTTMGWIERDWYLGPYKPELFDGSGNAGPTAWWDGRIVGGWRQADDGEVVLQLLEDVGSEGRRALEAEAERLGAWFGGTRALPRFPSPLSKALAK